MKKKIQKEFVCEQDRIMAAFAKVNLREAVTPIVRGKLVEDTDSYNKVQQLLDCPEMEHAHKFLLDIDFDDLSPETKQKIDDIYQLAISNGYIQADTDPNAEETDEVADEVGDEAADIAEGDDAQPQVSDNSGGFEAGAPGVSQDAVEKDTINVSAPEMTSCAFVLFYSAMKNGQIKTGECYSNATTIENAKLDAVQKLKKLGFTAVDIIAAEEADPSAKGCDSRQPDAFGEKAYETHADDAVTSSTPTDVADAVPTAPAKKEADNAKDDAEEEEAKAEKEDKSADKEEEKPEEEEPTDDKEEEPKDEEPEEEKEMSRSEKLEMFKEYLNEFKNLLQKMKAETYIEMSLADRAKFYDEMSKIWKDKPDPMTFMTDDNVDQIEHMRIKITK